MPNLKLAIKKGLGFLDGAQQADGSFLSYSSAQVNDFQAAQPKQTSFVPSIILSALATLDAPEAQAIKAKLADFLLTQKSPNWTFNYWHKSSPEFEDTPYPDDLDDTSCALSALYLYNPDLVDGEVMASIVKVLISNETGEGGPYTTWLVASKTDPAWNDVDLAVNCNIAFFLSLQQVDLPTVTSLVDKAILGGNYSSPYYPTEYPVVYFISRFYKSKQADIFNQHISQLLKPVPKNPADRALVLSAALNIGLEPSHLSGYIEYLLESQRPDGSWPAQGFCFDPYKQGKPRFAGAPALTTALVLEALAKYDQSFNGHKLKASAEEKIVKQVLARVQSRVATTDKSLQSSFEEIINEIMDAPLGKQVALMPYLFHKALGQKGAGINPALLAHLGIANLYGWIAYTIYDDFLDEEGDPRLLSAANLALRELTLEFYTLLPDNKQFWPAAQVILDGIDAANAWETANCRFSPTGAKLELPALTDYGDLSQLANRSFGHALGPLAIMYELGYVSASKDTKLLTKFFQHYLIARQLNDDAHDWLDDFKRGQVNAVAAHLLQTIQPKKTELLEVFMKRLQKYFWEKGIKEVAQQIQAHTTLARQALAKITIIQKPEIMLNLLAPMEKAAAEALQKHQDTEKFIKHLGLG